MEKSVLKDLNLGNGLGIFGPRRVAETARMNAASAAEMKALELRGTLVTSFLDRNWKKKQNYVKHHRTTGGGQWIARNRKAASML